MTTFLYLQLDIVYNGMLFKESFPQIPWKYKEVVWNVDSTRISGFKAIKCVIDRFCLGVVCVGSERYVGDGSTVSWGREVGGLPSYKCARTVTSSRKLIPPDGANVTLHSVLFRQIPSLLCTGLWNGSFIIQLTGRSIRRTSQNKTEETRFGVFLCPKRPDWCWDHPALYSSGINRLECEAEHTSPLPDDFKNTWS